MTLLLSGWIVAGYMVCGLFFIRFWKTSADKLFLAFGIAFWVLAAQRLMMIAWEGTDGREALLYAVRLFAFCLILAAIINKNREARR
jgi:hypothetical protein